MRAAKIKRRSFLENLNKKVRDSNKITEKKFAEEKLQDIEVEETEKNLSSSHESTDIELASSSFDKNIDNDEEREKLYDIDEEKSNVQHRVNSDNESEDFNIYTDSESSCDEICDEKATNKIEHDTEKHLCLSLREKLKLWAINFCVVQTIVTALLTILKEIFPCLPLHAKHLIKIQNKFTVEKFFSENSLDNSEFVYIGLAEQLKRIVNVINHSEKILKLQFNMDGLPLFKSGGLEFWPILGKINFQPDIYEPFIIAAYNGKGKPSLLSRYLIKFVNEVNDLLDSGIIIDNVSFTIEIMCFICDRPARSFVKNITGHTGYHACERCDQKGTRIDKRTIFPLVNARNRSDASFRSKDDPQHHLSGTCPLLQIK